MFILPSSALSSSALWWRGMERDSHPKEGGRAEILFAEGLLAQVWPVSSASIPGLLAWGFPPARGDDKLFQPHAVPKATPVPSAWGCQGCLRWDWGLWELGFNSNHPLQHQRSPVQPQQRPVAVITRETTAQHHLSTLFTHHTRSQPVGCCSRVPQLGWGPRAVHARGWAAPLLQRQGTDRGCKLSGPVKHLMILNLSASINT